MHPVRTPTPAPSTGRLRDYVLFARIDEGGMGEIWTARHTRSGAEVVLKLCKDGSPAGRERFVREARLSRRVQHENVVRVHELVRASDGRLGLAMERLEGASLAAMVATHGALPLAFVARAGASLASALATLHAADVVHRDLKPSNVFVALGDGGWCTKLLDFGVARDLRAAEEDAIVGTPGYMAPEQLRGLATDARADAWALGVVLHEALTGRALFAHDDVSASIRATFDAPIPRLDGRGLPGNVVEMIAGMLDRDVERRLADLSYVYRTLAGYAGLAPPPPSSLAFTDAPTLFSFAA